MKTVSTSKTGSNTMLPLTVNDKINIKAKIKSKLVNIHWRTLNECFGYRHNYGISYAIKNVISGDISN